MSQIFKNLKLVFTSKRCIMLFLLVIFLFLLVGFFFFDYELTLGNTWGLITYLWLGLHILVTILFALFVVGQVYKFKTLWSVKDSGKGQWIVWGILGSLITWCPSCSISLASYLGLSSILSLLPRHGLELKIAAVLLLLRSNVSMYRNLLVCKMKRK